MASSTLSGTVGDLVGSSTDKKLYTIASNTTLPEALAVLGTHNIYAVPVVNTDSGVCEGLLSLSDIASFLVQQFWKASGVSSFAATSALSTENLASHLKEVKHCFDTQTALATMSFVLFCWTSSCVVCCS
jgi:predicted transcriptional regulator